MHASPEWCQYCVLTRNLMENKDNLICFLMMLEDKVGWVHLTFSEDTQGYDKQLRAHIENVFANNNLPPFDFAACVAWPKVKKQISDLFEEIITIFREHGLEDSYKMPTGASTLVALLPKWRDTSKPPIWPFFQDSAVKQNMHWAIFLCSLE